MRRCPGAILQIHREDGLVRAILLARDAKGVAALVDQLGRSQSVVGLSVGVAIKLRVPVASYLYVPGQRVRLCRYRHQGTIDDLVER